MRAVIFDCDGVLVDSEFIAAQAVERLLALHAPSLDLTELHQTYYGISDEAMVDLLRDRYGVTLPDDFLVQAQDAIDEALLQDLEAIPGARDAVLQIDLPRAVASNSHRARVAQSLARAGLTDAFGGHLYCADMVDNPKPAPDVYLAAAAGLGLPAAACVAVEDSVTGTRAARSAGMTVVGFLGGRHIGPNDADQLRAAGAHPLAEDMFDVARVLQVMASIPA